MSKVLIVVYRGHIYSTGWEDNILDLTNEVLSVPFQASNSLPKTSYFKLVDVWLFFSINASRPQTIKGSIRANMLRQIVVVQHLSQARMYAE